MQLDFILYRERAVFYPSEVEDVQTFACSMWLLLLVLLLPCISKKLSADEKITVVLDKLKMRNYGQG